MGDWGEYFAGLVSGIRAVTKGMAVDEYPAEDESRLVVVLGYYPARSRAGL